MIIATSVAFCRVRERYAFYSFKFMVFLIPCLPLVIQKCRIKLQKSAVVQALNGRFVQHFFPISHVTNSVSRE